MLAQNFKSHVDLHLPEKHYEALKKTLVLLETEKLVHTMYEDAFVVPMSKDKQFTGHFNMDVWQGEHECGTVACIGGTAEMIGNVDFNDMKLPQGLLQLFHPVRDKTYVVNGSYPYAHITLAQAARALRNYLTTGEPKWGEVTS